MKNIVIDLDGTLTEVSSLSYPDQQVNKDVLQACVAWKAMGYRIIIHTSRNMRTFSGNVGKINVHTLPVILDWLHSNGVPFDEVIVGKPWCGDEGFYVDDRAIRPSEFANLTEPEIRKLISRENQSKE